MRMTGRLLAILTIAALLAPGVRWVSTHVGVEACACPPTACMCPGHHHTFGHTSMCGMANGGQCGMTSHDDFINSLLSSLIYLPTRHRVPDASALWFTSILSPHLSLLPSHARPLDEPPRIAL